MQVDVKQYLQYRLDLLNRCERYARGAKRLYDNAVDNITNYLSTINLDPSETFKLDGEHFKVIDGIMSQAEINIEQLIGKAVLNEFHNAGINTKSLMEYMLGNDYAGRIKKTIDGRIRSVTASNAIKFDMPKASLKVWNGTTLTHLESAIQEGIANGKSASGLAAYIKRFLNEPDNFYRRFRVKTGQDEEGNSIYGRKYKVRYITNEGKYKWRDATEAEMKRESGLYASSYKNAMRYARTTTNIAYRTADFDLYQTLPMVIGIEIKTSESNHHVSDICDSLKGKYPKTFKWTGWHPNCRCYEIPLLANKEDLDKMLDAIMNGDEPSSIEAKGRVTELPKNFNEWMEKNSKRIKEAAKNDKLPYFIIDNKQYVSKYLITDNNTANGGIKFAEGVNSTKQTAEIPIFDGDTIEAGRKKLDYIKQSLDIDDKLATEYLDCIESYTGALYSSIRAAQMYRVTGIIEQDISDIINELLDIGDKLDDFIDKAPKYYGTVYRGIYLNDGQINDMIGYISENKKISMKGTSSWTTDKDFAKDYKGSTNCIFVSKGQQYGTSICGYSMVQHEREILMSSKAEWKIISHNTDGKFHIFEVEPI